MSVAIPRSEWGARYGRYSVGTDPRGEEVVHITVNSELSASASQSLEAAAMRGVERYVVKQRNFYGFPYNHCGFQSGRIYEGQGWRHTGQHTQRGRNRTAYALARFGHPDVEPSEAFLATGRRLFAEGQARGHLTRDFVITGHRDHWPKACPGGPLYRRRGELRPGASTTIPGSTEEDDVLERGDKGGEVTWMQWRINQLLHEGQKNPKPEHGYGLAVDGDFGPETEKYVRHCQAQMGFSKHPGKATTAFLIRLDYLALRNVERAQARAA